MPARALLCLSLLLLTGCSFPGATAPTATPAPTAVPLAATATTTATATAIVAATSAAASAAPSLAATRPAAPTPTATLSPTVAATAATPTVAASPTAPPATPATPPVVATATSAVSASPSGPQTVRDLRQVCELTLPAGFSATNVPGSFASVDGKASIALQSLSAGPDDVLDDLALPFVGAFIPGVTGYRQTAVLRVADYLRIDFTGGLPQPGRGTLYFRQFGPAICVVTYFVVDGADSAYDAVFDALIASLRPRGVG